MNILCATDGSDDACEALAAFAQMIDARRVNEIRVILVAWPERDNALWDKAYQRWVKDDDLHEAMEATVNRELEKLRGVFSEHASTVETTRGEGDPGPAIVQSAQSISADLIVLAVTGNNTPEPVRNAVIAVVEKSPSPVAIVHGPKSSAKSITNIGAEGTAP